MEIVSRAGADAARRRPAPILRKLRSILRYIGSCDGNMEQGSHALPTRTSPSAAPASRSGTRCEIKNVNSIRFVMQAIDYGGPCARSRSWRERPREVRQETRLFDSGPRRHPRSMRSQRAGA